MMKFTKLKAVLYKVYISPFFVVALLLFFAGDAPLYPLSLLITIALHELSHIIALWHYGGKIQKISFLPCGIDLDCDTHSMSYKKELVCVLSGGFCNIFVALITFFLMKFYPSPELLFFCLCNTCLGIFNLIPLPFLDGGRALQLLLYDNLDYYKAYYISRSVDIISAFVFVALALFVVMFSSFNLSVLAVVVYGAVCMAGKNKLDI